MASRRRVTPSGSGAARSASGPGGDEGQDEGRAARAGRPRRAARTTPSPRAASSRRASRRSAARADQPAPGEVAFSTTGHLAMPRPALTTRSARAPSERRLRGPSRQGLSHRPTPPGRPPPCRRSPVPPARGRVRADRGQGTGPGIGVVDRDRGGGRGRSSPDGGRPARSRNPFARRRPGRPPSRGRPGGGGSPATRARRRGPSIHSASSTTKTWGAGWANQARIGRRKRVGSSPGRWWVSGTVRGLRPQQGEGRGPTRAGRTGHHERPSPRSSTVATPRSRSRRPTVARPGLAVNVPMRHPVRAGGRPGAGPLPAVIGPCRAATWAGPRSRRPIWTSWPSTVRPRPGGLPVGGAA